MKTENYVQIFLLDKLSVIFWQVAGTCGCRTFGFYKCGNF